MKQTSYNIAIIYLYRFDIPEEKFEKFIKSYKKYKPNLDHELIIIFKGCREYLIKKRMAFLKYYKINTVIKIYKDIGKDIYTYYKIANEIDYKYLLFFNSHSEIMQKNWLNFLYSYIQLNQVSLVGCSASFGTPIIINKNGSGKNNFYKILKNFYHKLRNLFLLKYFKVFPNFHIRTNGFIIEKDILLKITHKNLKKKINCHIFEHGKNSLTNQILNLNRKVIVVDKMGKFYDQDNISQSKIFWGSRQNDILVADNQTNLYAKSSAKRKNELRFYAWGK